MQLIKETLDRLSFLGSFNIKHFKSENEKYCILPSLQDPRWIVPVFDKRLFISSLALYQPSLLKAKFIKKMAILTAKSGLSEVIAKDNIYFQKKDDFIRELFKRDHLQYAIFTGTEGCHRKVTVQVMDKEGTILGYIKVSDNEETDMLLKNEAEVLKGLLRLEIRTGLFPKTIYHGHINDVNILILDSLKSMNSGFSSSLSDSHVDFLTEIFNKTSDLKVFSESKFANDLRDRIARLESGKLRDSHEIASDFIGRNIGNIKIPFGLCHRDFTPWNTFFHNGMLYVFDWEYAENGYPPLLDIYHFIIQDGILVRHLNPKGLLKKIEKNRRLINRYCDLIGIDKNLTTPLLLCYLLDISLLYFEREKGRMERELRHKIDIWAGMMELILVNS